MRSKPLENIDRGYKYNKIESVCVDKPKAKRNSVLDGIYIGAVIAIALWAVLALGGWLEWVVTL